MTSEPDSKAGRRPPTIELTAMEVDKPPPNSGASKTETPDSEPERPAPERGPRGRLKTHAAGAIIGAIVMLAVVAGLRITGFGPWRQAVNPRAPEAASPGAAAPTVVTDEALSARLDKVERAIETQRQESKAVPPAVADRLTAAEAQTKSLGDSVAALSHRVDGIAAANLDAVKQAEAAKSAADEAKNASQSANQIASRSGVQRSDIEAVTARVAALENAVKALSDTAAHPAAASDDRPARLTIAAEALRAAVERGAPYQAELAAALALGADQNAAKPLQPFAATGLPGDGTLAHELAALVPTLRHATEPTPGNATFLGRLAANAKSLVRVTPVDAPAGNNPSAVIARLNDDAARTDIAAALTDIAALPGAAKASAAGWIEKAQARAAAIAAGRQIAADALAALDKPAAR